MSTSVSEAIKIEINKTNDPSIRAVLTLLQAVLEDIKETLERSLHEDQVKSKALNGFVGKHHEHHAWLDKQIEGEEERELYCNRVKRAVEFVEARMEHGGYCSYVNKIVEQEKILANDKKSLVMKFLESIVSQLGTIALTAVLVYLGIKVI